jgi:hypothetical protein
MVERIAVVALLSASLAAADVWSPPDPGLVVVHEWGTFTSVAGEQGQATPWLPLESQNDLPCFVERFKHYRPKAALRGTLRMETPVLYFYAPSETTVDVSVRFNNGLITEWFPAATVAPAQPVGDDSLAKAGFTGTVRWPRVKIQPGGPERYPVQSRNSHYYRARETDAAPISVAGTSEKFLFYRGVAHTELPVSAVAAADGTVQVWTARGGPLGALVLFERRGNRIGFEVQSPRAARTVFRMPALDSDVDALASELERILGEEGLYAKEAAAMVNTWRESWFEEGTRLLYIVPAAAVDAMLPLSITPRPEQVVRVFVGRMELLSPPTRAEVRHALTTRDAGTLRKYGRFLLPFSERILAESTADINRAALPQFIYGTLAAVTRGGAPACP